MSIKENLKFNDVERYIVKLTSTKVKPLKPKHVHALTKVSWQNDISIDVVFELILSRFKEGHWVSVFKGLILIHLLIREGHTDKILSYLSANQNLLNLNNYRDKSNHINGQIQSKNVRSYASYLQQKVDSYICVKDDFVRSKQDLISKFRAFNYESMANLLENVECLQTQITALLDCSFYLDEIDNLVTLQAFRLLLGDAMVLFHILNEGVIKILGFYFEMDRSLASRSLEIYKVFAKQTTKTVELFEIARKLKGSLGVEVPAFNHAPVSLGGALEEYLNAPDFEAQRLSYKLKKSQQQKDEKSSSKPSANLTTAQTKRSESPGKKFPPPPEPLLIDFFESIDTVVERYNSPTNQNAFNVTNQNFTPFFQQPGSANPFGNQQLQNQHSGGSAFNQQQHSIGSPFNQQQNQAGGSPFNQQQHSIGSPFNQQQNQAGGSPFNQQQNQAGGSPFNQQQNQAGGSPFNQQQNQAGARGSPVNQQQNPFNQQQNNFGGGNPFAMAPLREPSQSAFTVENVFGNSNNSPFVKPLDRSYTGTPITMNHQQIQLKQNHTGSSTPDRTLKGNVDPFMFNSQNKSVINQSTAGFSSSGSTVSSISSFQPSTVSDLHFQQQHQKQQQQQSNFRQQIPNASGGGDPFKGLNPFVSNQPQSVTAGMPLNVIASFSNTPNPYHQQPFFEGNNANLPFGNTNQPFSSSNQQQQFQQQNFGGNQQNGGQHNPFMQTGGAQFPPGSTNPNQMIFTNNGGGGSEVGNPFTPRSEVGNASFSPQNNGFVNGNRPMNNLY